MTKTIPTRAPGAGGFSSDQPTSQPRGLALADGVTRLPLHGIKVWQGRPWELAAMLLGSLSLLWIALPAA